MAVASLTASAQFYFGGQVGFSRNATHNETTVVIAPEVGYSFNEKWTFGGILEYDYGYASGYDVNVFEILPYARYKFAHLADNKVQFFCDGRVGFGVQKGKGQDAGFVYEIGLRPGVAFNVNSHWSLVAHLGQLGWEGATDKATGLYARSNQFTWNIFNWNDIRLGFYYSF